MPRRYKHNRGGWKLCVRTILYIICLHSALFFVYYTLLLANKQAYLDYYYPTPTPADFNKPRPNVNIPKPIVDTKSINEDDEICSDESCQADNNIEGNDSILNNSKYNIDLHNDPSKYVLLASLFKTLDNAEICEFFEAKAAKRKLAINDNLDWNNHNRKIYVLTYNVQYCPNA